MKNDFNNKPINETEELSEEKKEFERIKFLEKLEQQELDLVTENSKYSVSNIQKKAKEEFNKKIKKMIIMVLVLLVFCFGVSKLFYYLASNLTESTNTSVNTSVVEIALVNYKRDYGNFPVDADNKVNTSILRQKGYLSSNVEDNCDCYFYLATKNGTVKTVKR